MEKVSPFFVLCLAMLQLFSKSQPHTLQHQTDFQFPFPTASNTILPALQKTQMPGWSLGVLTLCVQLGVHFSYPCIVT